MKRPTIIILLLLIVTFFTFFRIVITKSDKLNFINQYKQEIEFSDFKIEKIINNNDNELIIRFLQCNIDSNNIKNYISINKIIARDVNLNLNRDNKYNYINVIFIPINSNGIQLTTTIRIYDLSYKYHIDKL